MKNQQAWEKSLRRLNHTTQEWPLFIMQEYKAQPRLQREGGRENLTIGLQQLIATLLRRTQIGLCTVVHAFIWRGSSASKPVEKAVLLNSLP